MSTKAWRNLKKDRLSTEALDRVNRAVEGDLLEMDLRALRRSRVDPTADPRNMLTHGRVVNRFERQDIKAPRHGQCLQLLGDAFGLKWIADAFQGEIDIGLGLGTSLGTRAKQDGTGDGWELCEHRTDLI